MAQPSEHNQQFRASHPDVWLAFSKLADACHSAGPLDEKTRRLLKLAFALASGLEGATHSAVRQAKDAGVTQDEMAHVAILAITTLGFPNAMRAMSWIGDGVKK